METIDIINERNEVIGQTTKDEAHKEGILHRVVAILLCNDKGEYFIPSGSATKPGEEGKLYHSAAGHVMSGETYLQAASRELREETNIHIDEKYFSFLGEYQFEATRAGKQINERFEVYKTEYRESLGDIILNDEQVDGQWLTLENLMELNTDTPEIFSGPLKVSCDMFFSLKK